MCSYFSCSLWFAAKAPPWRPPLSLRPDVIPIAAHRIRSLIKTKTPKVETERYGPREEKHFERLFSLIRAYLDAVGGNRYHIRPGLHCSFCDFRELGCRW